MTDVNQMEYAKNFLRLEDSARDGIGFLGNSGEWFGTLIAVFIIFLFLAVIAGLGVFILYKFKILGR